MIFPKFSKIFRGFSNIFRGFSTLFHGAYPANVIVVSYKEPCSTHRFRLATHVPTYQFPWPGKRANIFRDSFDSTFLGCFKKRPTPPNPLCESSIFRNISHLSKLHNQPASWENSQHHLCRFKIGIGHRSRAPLVSEFIRSVARGRAARVSERRESGLGRGHERAGGPRVES